MPAPTPNSPSGHQDFVKVDVQIFANLREFTGFKKRYFYVAKGSTIRELFQHIAANIPHGAEFIDETTENDGRLLKQYVKVILDGRILFTEQAMETSIVGSDVSETVVAIFPPVGGG
ncbi:MAG: MoaD/ThiS family protein [Promethearchaeota archaeon]